MRVFSIVGGVLALSISISAVPQGLGGGLTGRRVTATLTRKAASAISLSGNTVRLNITVTAQTTVPRQYADALRTRLTADIFKDPRIVEEPRTPDVILEATINEFSYAMRASPRTYFNIQRRANVTVQDRIVSGAIALSYRTLNGRDKKGLDAGNLQFGFEEEFTPEGQPYREIGRKHDEPFNHVPTRQEVDPYLIDGMVALVAKHIVSVDETVVVPLPMGKLEAASKLGAASRWGAMIEELEKMPALTPTTDEAYRQYGIGVANEALAYQEADARQKQDFLAKAALGYKNAIRLNGGENEFHAAQNRLATYLAPDAASTESAAPPATSAAVSRSLSGGGGPAVFKNDDVIKLTAEKFSEEFILDAIASAKQVDFDVSTNGLVALKRAGVTEKVIKAMRDRVK